MSVPENPTAGELVTEALAQAGESSPSAALTTRATGNWMAEIKNDIWKRSKRLKLLHVTAHGVVIKGQARYSYPSDFSSDLEATLLDGSTSGTAQGGTTSTITLSSTEAIAEGQIIGRDVLITAGTGTGSLGQVISYNASTKVATVAPNFRTAPASGSTYLVIDREIPVTQKPINQYSLFRRGGVGEPRYYFPMGDEDYGEFLLDVAPEKTFGARLIYYANVMKVDTDSTLMGTVYGQWRTIFIEGLKWKMFSEADDDRQDAQWQKYQRELNTLITRETYGVDLSNLTDTVRDFR